MTSIPSVDGYIALYIRHPASRHRLVRLPACRPFLLPSQSQRLLQYVGGPLGKFSVFRSPRFSSVDHGISETWNGYVACRLCMRKTASSGAISSAQGARTIIARVRRGSAAV